MDDASNNLYQLPEFSVSELSRALKKTIETTFARVRIKGEISGLKRHTSGHVYFALKDSEALIDGVCWRGQYSNLSFHPEDGMEVICTGKITTYSARSKYQIVVDSFEIAGEGALLKLLEQRKKTLAAEGLFADERKKPLPFLPNIIGVVTSPTGAVIRDILHRIEDRFPRHVLLWPVQVQCNGAAEQIAHAIEGFNNLTALRPDIILVARGGGSLEDLWPFNEEIVVRAAANSDIPLISAVGHETDVTLIDYAADLRAPTPTAAAEIAVPVRTDLIASMYDRSQRLITAVDRVINERTTTLTALVRVLPNLERLTDEYFQRLDDWQERLRNALKTLVAQQQTRLSAIENLQNIIKRLLSDKASTYKTQQLLLESYSFRGTLKRGFSIIKNKEGKAVTRKSQTSPKMLIDVVFYDGVVRTKI